MVWHGYVPRHDGKPAAKVTGPDRRQAWDPGGDQGEPSTGGVPAGTGRNEIRSVATRPPSQLHVSTILRRRCKSTFSDHLDASALRRGSFQMRDL